jgi:hypothetical protein
VALDSPLIVLTEGGTDSRLLSDGMKITHPHLSGFINFIDFDSFNAEGGVAMLPKIVYAFVASGVANRIAAIGDNDTEAHDALEKIKKDPNLPENVRILHYPDLPTLKNYPTLGPYSPNPVLTDINRSAGALEMYLGRDVLTSMANSYRSSGGTTTPSSGGTRAHSWTRTRRPSRRRSRRRSSRRSPAAAPQRRKTGAG